MTAANLPPLHRNRAFLALSLTQGLSHYAEFAFLMAAVGTMTATTRSPLYVSLVTVSQWLPGLALSPLAGWVVDRFDRRRAILAANASRALLAALLVAVPPGPATILACTLLMSLPARLFAAAHFALLPVVAGPANLQRANAVANLILNVGYAGGMFLTSVLVDRLGWQAAVGLIAFLLALACVPALFVRAAPAAGPGTVPVGAVWTWMIRQPGIVLGLGLAAGVGILWGPLSLLPTYITTVLGQSVVQYGLVEGISVVGVLLGTALLARVAVDRPGRGMLAAVGVSAGGLLWVAGASRVAIIAPARLLMCFANTVFNVLYTTTLHRLVPREYLGRAFSLGFIVSTVPYILTAGLAGLAAEELPFRSVWVGAAGLGLAAMAASLVLARQVEARVRSRQAVAARLAGESWGSEARVP